MVFMAGGEGVAGARGSAGFGGVGLATELGAVGGMFWPAVE